MDEVRVLDDPATAALVLDPVRQSLLTALREPGSAASLAAAAGMSRQRIGYHLRTLEEHGLIEQVGERRWGGITERMLVAAASSYLISTDVLGELGATPRMVTDRLSAHYLIALAAQAMRDVAVLSRRSRTQRRPLATLSLDTTIRFASAAERARFADELAATVRSFAARYHRPKARGGRDHHLVVLAYPATPERTGHG